MNEKPSVVIARVMAMQLCVPAQWTDEQVIVFAESQRHTGWKIRKAGHPKLNGDPERAPCEDRRGYVHIAVELEKQ